MILHGWAFSPFVRTVRAALRMAGVAHDLRETNPGALAEPAFRALSPFGKVPAIEAAGLRLTETAAILAYLDAGHPQAGLLPAGAEARGRAFEIVLQAGAYLYPVGVMGLFFQDAYIRANGGTPDAARVAEAAAATAPLLDPFAARIAGAFLLGERPCAADLALGAMLHNVALTEAGAALIAERPALAAWLARLRAVPAFAETEAPIPRFGLPA